MTTIPLIRFVCDACHQQEDVHQEDSYTFFLEGRWRVTSPGGHFCPACEKDIDHTFPKG